MENILEKFRDFLLEKGYKPGDRISTEMELVSHFGVSRGKVREATTTLCQLGILEKKPRRGTVLREFDASAVGCDLGFRFTLADFNPAEFMEARMIVEEAIIPLVVRRITPIQISELDALVEKMGDNLDNPQVFDSADREFHLNLLHACGNRVLQSFAQVIQILFQEKHRQVYWKREIFHKVVQKHGELVQAIRSDDLDKTRQALLEHFNIT